MHALAYRLCDRALLCLAIPTSSYYPKGIIETNVGMALSRVEGKNYKIFYLCHIGYSRST